MKMQHGEPFATGVSTRHPAWPGGSHQGRGRLSRPSLQMSAVAADVCRLPGQRCCPRGGRWKAPNVPLARASGPLGDGARPGSGAARHRRACSSASRAPPGRRPAPRETVGLCPTPWRLDFSRHILFPSLWSVQKREFDSGAQVRARVLTCWVPLENHT